MQRTALAIVVIVALAGAAPALASTPTKAAYIKPADVICRAEGTRLAPILKQYKYAQITDSDSTDYVKAAQLLTGR